MQPGHENYKYMQIIRMVPPKRGKFREAQAASYKLAMQEVNMGNFQLIAE